MPITHDHDFRSPEELDALFYDQSWMITCRNQENGSYQKYLTDLTDAWKAADAQTRQQLADGQPPTALAKCIRYALIHTTIVGNLGHPSALRSVYSDDADLPPDPDALKELLTDEDTPADPSPLTLESSAQIENLRKRASALIELLKDAAEEDRDALLLAIVETILAIQDKFMGFPNHLWNGLEDYLTAERVAYYSRLIFASPNEVACAWFIFEWARKFNRKLLAEAIDTTFSFQDAFVRTVTLLPIVERTHGTQRARILQQMYRALPHMDNPQLKSRVLLILVGELKGKKRAVVVQQAILTIPRVPGFSRGWDAARLMRYLTRAQRTRFLTKILSSPDAASRVEACITLWRYLPQKTRQQMVNRTLQVRDLPERAKFLAQIAYHLRSGEGYPEAIQQIVNAINGIRNEDYRRSTILAVQKVVQDDAITQAASLPVKRLTADVETLPGYRFAFAQCDPQWVAYALGKLSAFMNTALKTRALSLMVDLALETEPHDYTAEAIEGIAPYLDEAHLDSALEGALRISDNSSRVWALSGLAPFLTGERLERCLQEALDSSGLLNDPSSQADGWYAADMAARTLTLAQRPYPGTCAEQCAGYRQTGPGSLISMRESNSWRIWTRKHSPIWLKKFFRIFKRSPNRILTATHSAHSRAWHPICRRILSRPPFRAPKAFRIVMLVNAQ